MYDAGSQVVERMHARWGFRDVGTVENPVANGRDVVRREVRASGRICLAADGGQFGARMTEPEAKSENATYGTRDRVGSACLVCLTCV